MNLETRQEVPPVELYTGTYIEKLTPERDTEWLTIVIDDPGVSVTPEFIDKLNAIADTTKLINNGGSRRGESGRREEFYRQLGWLNPMHPVHEAFVETASTSMKSRPQHMIEVLRIIYEHAGEQLLLVVEKKTGLLRMSIGALVERTELLKANNIDVAAVWLYGQRSFVSPKLVDLIEQCNKTLRLAEKRKASVMKAAGSVAMAEKTGESVAAKPRERYVVFETLAQLTGLDPDAIAVACPEVVDIGQDAIDKLVGLAKQADEEADERMTLRQLLFAVRELKENKKVE